MPGEFLEESNIIPSPWASCLALAFAPVVRAVSLISFLLIAFIVFMIVKAIARAGARTTVAATPGQALSTEIRNLLSGR